MGNDLIVEMRANGVGQMNAALDSVANRFGKVSNAQKQLQGSLRGTGQVFNQVGNALASVGQNQIGMMLGRIEASVMAVTMLNNELGKSKIALAAVGAAGFAAGAGVADFFAQFLPSVKAAEASSQLRQAGEIKFSAVNQRLALFNAEIAQNQAVLKSIDERIVSVKELKIADEERINITTELEKLKDATVTQFESRREQAVDKLWQDLNAMRGMLVRDSSFASGGERGYRNFTSEQGPKVLALEREYDARLEAFQKFSSDKDQILKFSEQNEAARNDAKNRLIADMDKESLDGRLTMMSDTSRAIGGIFGDLAETAKAFGKEGFAVWKGLSIAQATIATFTSAVEAYKATVGIPYIGPALAPAAAGAAVAAGLANVAQIAAVQPEGFMSGGYTGDGPRNEVAGMAHRGEFVIHAPAVSRIGIEPLEQLNAGGSPGRGGGTNVTVPVFFNQSAMRDFLKSRAFSDEVKQIVRISKMEVGIK